MRRPPAVAGGQPSSVSIPLIPDVPLLAGEEPWVLTQTAILAAIRLVVVLDLLIRLRIPAHHLVLV